MTQQERETKRRDLLKALQKTESPKAHRDLVKAVRRLEKEARDEERKKNKWKQIYGLRLLHDLFTEEETT